MQSVQSTALCALPSLLKVRGGHGPSLRMAWHVHRSGKLQAVYTIVDQSGIKFDNFHGDASFEDQFWVRFGFGYCCDRGVGSFDLLAWVPCLSENAKHDNARAHQAIIAATTLEQSATLS